jgi:brefeldin A-inhibited guanine nucleotide-exchange protein
MFDLLWLSALATFSLLFEEQDQTIVALVLTGYERAIRVACALQLPLSREAFLSSLKKHTLLGSHKEMRAKHIRAIQALLSLAQTEGNHMQSSWKDVLETISQIDHLHALRAGQGSADIFRADASAGAAVPSRGPAPRSSGLAQILDLNSALVTEHVQRASMDRVFALSASLSSDAIIDFVDCLRLVSLHELKSAGDPRVYSLQRIVEITTYNMSRIRIVWSKIWVTPITLIRWNPNVMHSSRCYLVLFSQAILSPYFVTAGCHANARVSVYAIDSLRQLSMKFLEIEELASYQFQKQFMKPFEVIMVNNPSPDAKQLVLDCLDRMIRVISPFLRPDPGHPHIPITPTRCVGRASKVGGPKSATC